MRTTGNQNYLVQLGNAGPGLDEGDERSWLRTLDVPKEYRKTRTMDNSRTIKMDAWVPGFWLETESPVLRLR